MEGENAPEEEIQRKSWKDTVLSPSLLPGNLRFLIEVEEEDSDEEEDCEGNDIPTIKIPQELKEKMRKPWRKTLIIKILGRTVAYKTLINRVTNLWKLEGEFECIDLSYGFYAIKFQNMVDRAKVLMEGPWKIMDHYITVQRWRPNFVVASASDNVFIRNCRELIQEENPTIICLLETKAKAGTGYSLQKKLRFNAHFEVPVEGLRGAYVQPHSTKKEKFWEDIYIYARNVDQPWMIVGDFNDFATLNDIFTWTRQHQGRVILQERLDRLLYNIDMVDFFPNLRVVTLTRIYSDHNPILVNTDLEIPMDKDKHPFRFEAAWLTHEEFKMVFNSAWDRKKHSLVDEIEEVKHAIISWKDSNFGNIFKRKKTLTNRLQGIQRSPHYFHSNFLQDLEKLPMNYDRFIPILNEEDKLNLNKQVTMEEVKEALFTMKGMKAPGPDDIRPIFYNQNWDTVKNTLCDFANMALELGKMDTKILRTFLVLIPKHATADNITQFFPISLLNTAYKIFSKIIVHRLCPLLQRLIGGLTRIAFLKEEAPQIIFWLCRRRSTP
ncbi:hypothetical protein F3Y22_tig00117001pilonHSYRG00005 [Hibiscus syriacus]|uniref:Uncharacterized protein n=1 Tax=Hibiscus syriacus TaxID=106335 RepID=A0A6A2WDG6_HIBSY|nr:hypothetical protein F3Y22_tig00117001pilonHSYRG00005 [Hibiscus syriacus]